MSAQRITAVEITAYDPALPGTRVLYFSTGRLVTGPSDTPALTWFDDRGIEVPNFERRAFGNARVTSGGTATSGVLQLAAADQALAGLLDLGLDGRSIVIRQGYEGDAYPAGWTTWLAGTVETIEMGQDIATLRISDRTALLDLPLQENRYAGSNSGIPLAGVEGVAGDIKGLEKPLCWGKCPQVPAVLVNTYYRTYQIHDGAVQAIDAVYDRGAAITFGANHGNVAALHAATVAAGTYDTCLALGLFRLGDIAVGRVTADVRGDASGTGYVDRAGAVMRRVLEAKCGIPTGEIDTASFTALDTAAPYELGIFIGAATTRRAVIDQLAASVGAYSLPNALGIWTTGQLVAPTSSTTTELTDADMANVQREATRDPGRGIPVWQVSLRYGRNWTTFSPTDLVAISGTFTEAQRAALLQEWRTAVASDAAVQTKHIKATTLEYDTLLTTEADAVAEAARRLALHKVRRDYLRVPAPIADDSPVLDLLQEVKLETPVAGLAGRQFAILGIITEGRTVTYELWG
jgi:hypothetical protein